MRRLVVTNLSYSLLLLFSFDHLLTRSAYKVGLLIGPRGNTLKKMETESQAKIAIRGKGSVKEGKGRSDAAHTSNQEEDLHCLIMADTEEKVNKAKKLIHNIIETVSRSFPCPDEVLTIDRLPLSLRDRTSSSATNFVNLLRSTVRYATMRTKPVRTVVRSDTESTTAQNSATSPPISSVASVVMLVTWLEIVQTDSVAPTGAMMAQVLPLVLKLLAALALVMPWTESTR